MRHAFLLLLTAAATTLAAQPHTDGTELTFELSGTAATGDYAPLWLTANRYGMGSVEARSYYERARIERDIRRDDTRTWRLGYGLDLAVAFGHERHAIVEQAYAEVAWRRIRLTAGAKQQPMETQNAELSSGALALGANARPVPQARLDVDWFALPGTRGWWQWKFHGSYGCMTDGKWQEGWAAEGQRYATGTLYHEKALYWQFGRTDVLPWTYEIGIRLASEFGGRSYNVRTTRANGGAATTYHHATDFRAFVDALLCRGSDATDGSNPNVAGNHLGSYVMQLRYHGRRWQARAYWERFFEDHSMLTVQYGIRDMLVGGEVTLPRNPFVGSAVLEFITTTNQSGAVYHDATYTLPDAIAGRDNYYNHTHYAGWQHYGQTLGNPLLISPLYNAALGHAHQLRFFDNRIKAWHVGLGGDPSPEWHWRAMASFTRNWGIYEIPLDDILRQTYVMAEATYRPRWADGWRGTLGVGLDHGALIGNSVGAQLTVARTLGL